MAALTVIVLGVLSFFVVMRRRPSPERLGFAALNEIPPSANEIAERLFAERPYAIFQRRAVDQDMYLMFVEAGSSETPDCVVCFSDITISHKTADIAVLNSQRRIPDFLRRLQGGIFKWARSVDPATDSLRPGTGWFWYAAEGGSVEDTPVARAVVHATRDGYSRKLLGLASLGSHLIVWASLPHIDAVVSRLENLTQNEGNSAENDGL